MCSRKCFPAPLTDMRGIITDIQRFSLSDGPGIRTTVFLKGCPLRCQWCHNPETQSPRPELRFDRDKCTLCAACAKVCGMHRVSGGTHMIDLDRCNACGACVDACPAGALSLFGREADTEEILAEVMRDEKYYLSSGGGLTLSGGEPLYQPAFAHDILSKAKEKGLHTCVETALYVDEAAVRLAAPVTDLFLADWKLGDAALHKTYTGAGNNLIRKNIALLSQLGAKLILRCPIIPTVNDKAFHYDSIAQIANTTAAVKSVELMAYHTIGQPKYRQTGREYKLPTLKDLSVGDKELILAQVQSRCDKPVKWG